jgi:hypothetical protein
MPSGFQLKGIASLLGVRTLCINSGMDNHCCSVQNKVTVEHFLFKQERKKGQYRPKTISCYYSFKVHSRSLYFLFCIHVFLPVAVNPC